MQSATVALRKIPLLNGTIVAARQLALAKFNTALLESHIWTELMRPRWPVRVIWVLKVALTNKDDVAGRNNLQVASLDPASSNFSPSETAVTAWVKRLISLGNPANYKLKKTLIQPISI